MTPLAVNHFCVLCEGTIDLRVISWPPDVLVLQWLVRSTLAMNVFSTRDGNPISVASPLLYP